jgi:hypothetical protein
MIGPGSPNALLLAQAGDPLDELGIIKNALRFNSPDAPYLWRSIAAGANRKKGALSVWLHPTKIVSASISNNQNMHVFMSHNGTNVAGSGMTAYSRIAFVGDDTNALNRLQLHSSGSAGEAFTSNGFYRDPNSPGHLYLRWDTTVQMLECYWNGVEISYASKTLPTLNADTMIGVAAGIMLLGAFTTADPRHFDGYMAWPTVLLGNAPAVTSFGQSHPRTGQWRPKKFSGAYGAYDSFLDFSDGSAATSSALGKDRSGNNDWTPVNVSVVDGNGKDWLPSTPTNNICTLNLLASGGQAISNGALTASSGSTNTATHGTFKIGNDDLPIYFEVESTVTTNAATAIGFGVVGEAVSPWANYQISGVQFIAGFYASNFQYIMRDNATNFQVVAAAVPAGTKFQCAIKGNKVWIGKAGVYWDSAGGTTGNPETEANPTITIDANVRRHAYLHVANNTAHINFGQRPFDYTPPSWAVLPGTKKLPIKPAGPMKSSDAFVAVTAAGASIQSTLAAARTGWSGYIDIIKRYDAGEGWRWIFSDDPTNFLDSSGTAAKAAVPSFAGSAYVGYSMKVSPANGVATGVINHVDVVADGLGKTKKVVMLRAEAGGNWFVYHPDLTAGKLLYLNSSAAETTDATISAITSSGFTVAAALATGAYRWIALADTEGILRIGNWIGNSSADGAFDNEYMVPELVITKTPTNASTSWFVLDGVRETTNPRSSTLFANSTGGNTTGYLRDHVSSGLKWRWGGGDPNTNGAKNIYIAFGKAPFRYANAR